MPIRTALYLESASGFRITDHNHKLVTMEEAKRRWTSGQVAECNMAPYDENGEWFADGSRWDWYKIGGRFTGQLSDYDPEKDPKNYSECEWCVGTGIRPGGLQEFGQAWFDANHGCNGCNGTGRSINFSLVPFEGDVGEVAL